MDKEENNINKKYPPRISNRVINHKYIAYTVDALVAETILPFDCYIKRYGDYVVIIQAGTFMSKELLGKLKKNTEIYFLKSNSEKINQYLHDHNSGNVSQNHASSDNEVIKAALNLPDTLFNLFGTREEHLSILYTTTSNLMMQIFDDANETLPLDALYTCIAELAKYVDPETNVLPMLLKCIPDEYTTHHHSTNVAFFAVLLGNAIHLSQEEIADIGFAGLLHDIGKIRIDLNLLMKPSPLNDDEYEIIKHHSEYSYAILKKNGINNQKILNAVQYHHERLDGSGYPKRLRNRLIPTYARILGMCDAFDALTTKRTFRDNYTSYEALLVMKRDMAAQFDKLYIDTFIGMMK